MSKQINGESGEVHMDIRCDRCGQKMTGTLKEGEIRFNYEKRATD